MKKIYTILAAGLFAATSSFAQTKVIDLEVTQISPSAGTSVVVGTPFTYVVQFKNKGTASIAPTDTLLFTFTGASGNYFITGKTKAPNDTIMLNTTLTFSAATNGTRNFCTAAIISRTTDPDTTNNTSCKSITITGGTTGIAVLKASMDQSPEQLTVYPTPAINTINLNYTARNNAEVTARIVDISGRVVMEHSFGKAYQGKSDFSLDISSLRSGLYFVELRQSGVRAVGKMNKQ